MKEFQMRVKAAVQCLRGKSVIIGWQISDFPDSGAIVVDRAGTVVVGPATLVPKGEAYIAHNDIIGPQASENVVQMNPAGRFYGR